MSDNITNNKNVKDDEIDLLDLFRRIGNTFRRWLDALGKGILISTVFIIRRWLPLGLSIIIGLAVSYLLRSTSESFYNSDMVLRNNMLQTNIQNNVLQQNKENQRRNSGTTSELISRINKLHFLCAEKNIPALSKALSVSPDLLKNVSDISAFWIIDKGKDGVPDYVDYLGEHNIYDTVNVRMIQNLDVRVMFTTQADLNLVQNGILKYISNDSLNQQRNKLRLKQNRDMLTRLTYDINQLDSLQKVKLFEETRNIKPTKEGQIIFMQDQKTQLLYNDIQYLYSKKQQLEVENDLYNDVVTVLSDFSLPVLKNSGARYYGKIIIPIFFLTTLLVLIIYANRKKLNEIYNKY